jgi:hypothetical protein
MRRIAFDSRLSGHLAHTLFSLFFNNGRTCSIWIRLGRLWLRVDACPSSHPCILINSSKHRSSQRKDQLSFKSAPTPQIYNQPCCYHHHQVFICLGFRFCFSISTDTAKDKQIPQFTHTGTRIGFGRGRVCFSEKGKVGRSSQDGRQWGGRLVCHASGAQEHAHSSNNGFIF